MIPLVIVAIVKICFLTFLHALGVHESVFVECYSIAFAMIPDVLVGV